MSDALRQFTKNLPWFVKDPAVALIGPVRQLRLSKLL